MSVVTSSEAIHGSCVTKQAPADIVLSVIVPVYNESKTIVGVVERLRATKIPMEIVIVDDGSSDATSEKMAALSDLPEVEGFRHETNLGKGAAVRTGIEKSTGDFIVVQDADQEYSPEDLSKLLQPLFDGKADVVYGTRYGGNGRRLYGFWHQAANAFITFLASAVIGIRFSDIETCYKMASREHYMAVLKELKESRFGIEIELTAKWARMGLRFAECPISYYPRWYDEGKKIGWRDGVSALRCIVKYGLFNF